VFTATVETSNYAPTTNALNNTEYSWRVRARQDGATGPWSAAATFTTPTANTGALVTDGFRTPDPPAGSRLPLPVETGVINAQYTQNFNDWQNSCQDTQGERGWIWLDKLVDALATAGLIGAVVADRASLSGAEGGCQAETGAAAGMAAGAAVEMLGGTPSQVGHATALAQQGTLGLVCDPLGGLVELPCVFRNATGAAIALAAIEMAMAGITFAIPADEVIDTMGEIGREMDVRYRETAGGGLAATPTGRRLARERLVQIKRGGGE
jgi:hypothetical protein